jgi:hypothetical protein
VGDATGGSYTNIVTVQAEDDEGNQATDSDTATVGYTDVLPDTIQIVKTHMGTLLEGTAGQQVTYHYSIGNNTNSIEALYVTSLVDTFTLPGGGKLVVDLYALFQAANPNADKSLVDPEQFIEFDFVYTAGLANANSDIDNTVAIESFDNEGNPSKAQASDTVAYQDVKPEITITKTPDVTAVPPGGAVLFTYEVRNTSSAGSYDPLSNVVLSDTDGTPTFRGGDTNGNNKIDPDEVWTYDLTITLNSFGEHTNTATVAALDDEGNPA